MGDYLQKDFQAGELTMEQIVGLLDFHSIKRPSKYNKSLLVKSFNENIGANREDLLQLRDQQAKVVASDEGILDGVTGVLLRDSQR